MGKNKENNKQENKYISVVQLEFKEIIENLLSSNRKDFHMFTIHRILSLSLLVDFSFSYVPSDKLREEVCIQLDLGEWGCSHFVVDIDSNYARIRTEEDRGVLEAFIQTYDTRILERGKKRKIF